MTPDTTALALPREAKDRRHFIGSSDIAAVLGISRWKTPLELWAEKTAKTAPEDIDAVQLRRGRRAEPYIVEWLQEEKDFWIVDRNARVTHPQHSFLAAESDFTYIIDQGRPEGIDDPAYLLFDGNIGHGEAKSIGQFADWSLWGESGSQECPSYYIAQALFALECNGLPEATIAGASNWDDVRLYRFERDLDTGAAIVQKAIDFWNKYVLPGVPPPPVTAEDTKTILKRYGSFDWSASTEAIGLGRKCMRIRERIKRMEQAKEKRDKEFLACLIEAAGAQGVEDTEFKKARVLWPNGQTLASLTEINRKGYSVGPTSFTQLRFAGLKEE